jgi:transposase
VRPVGPAEAARKQIGRDLGAEIRELDARLATMTAQMSKTLTEHGSRLTDVDGIGPIVATRLLGRTGRSSRFPSSSAFAS